MLGLGQPQRLIESVRERRQHLALRRRLGLNTAGCQLVLCALSVVGCVTSAPKLHLEDLTASKAVQLFIWLTTLEDITDVNAVSRGLQLTPKFEPGTEIFVKNQRVVNYIQIFHDRPLTPGSPHRVNYLARDPKSVLAGYPDLTSYRGALDFSFRTSAICITNKQLEAVWGEGRPMPPMPPQPSAVSSQSVDHLPSADRVEIVKDAGIGYTWNVSSHQAKNNFFVSASISDGCFTRISLSQSDPTPILPVSPK